MVQTNYNDQPDERLMEIFIADKSPEVFEVIYNRYFISLSKYITWFTQDMQQAKDIVQNIFIKVYSKPELYDASRMFKIWLFTIAKNNWKNEMRHKKVQQKHQEFLLLQLKNNQNDLEYEQDIHELKRIQKNIHLLSASHKEVITLKYSNNLTITEISEIIGCSVGTVKSRLFYAIKSLKELILS